MGKIIPVSYQVSSSSFLTGIQLRDLLNQLVEQRQSEKAKKHKLVCINFNVYRQF